MGPLPSARKRLAGNHLGEDDVFLRTEFGQKMVELIDKAQHIPADLSAVPIIQVSAFFILNNDIAPIRLF